MKRFAPILALAVLVGCSAQQPGGATSITPAQQCQLAQTATTTAETGVLLAKIKDATTRMAIDAALAGVHAGADSYCAAVTAGQSPDAVASLLSAFNAAIANFNAALRAAQATPAAVGKAEMPKTGDHATRLAYFADDRAFFLIARSRTCAGVTSRGTSLTRMHGGRASNVRIRRS